MALAIFDLDHTLLNGDSDYLWGQFLVNKGIVEREYYERENQRYFDEYRAGTLDIFAFLAFSLEPLTRFSMEELAELHREYMQTSIHPIILPAGRALIEKHRQQGDTLIIITATNRFVTEPIAKELGIDNLLATTPEISQGRYTGRVDGIPCFKDGKVKNLYQWLAGSGETLEESRFYSDSLNDIPLLELVTYPVAVDPDETLEQHAEMKGWEIISLR
ncbi:MAG: HAD-IB family hydrolase [Gammaproteobacteria bacterium]|nr:HAD-IB family hydrolase [Gammaproteobacteria bacterium]MDH5651446.1 HAD-IB family hydrolase [Gammaproteobacteria bacterium]